MTDHAAALSRMVLADRFEITIDPLGWRCRACGASRSAEVKQPTPDDGRPPAAVSDLAEAAADHGLECGRCSD